MSLPRILARALRAPRADGWCGGWTWRAPMVRRGLTLRRVHRQFGQPRRKSAIREFPRTASESLASSSVRVQRSTCESKVR
eukprot:6929804-Pyramimonas_sp.AAC.1